MMIGILVHVSTTEIGPRACFEVGYVERESYWEEEDLGPYLLVVVMNEMLPELLN